MGISNQSRQTIHLLGDLFFLIFALWLALALRQLSIPSAEFFEKHLLSFSLLFVIWLFVFYAAGLYDKRTAILKKGLPGTILNVQAVNVAIAVLVFYLFPELEMSPKTVLFIYLIVSFVLILGWRIGIEHLLRRRRERRLLLVGEGPDIDELALEIEKNRLYGMAVERESLDINKGLSGDYSMVIADLRDSEIRKKFSEIYDLMVSGIPVIDAERVYEDLFEKIPLSSLEQRWFLKEIAFYSPSIYDPIKRMIDIGLSLIIGLCSLVLYPFVWLAIKIDDGGPLFIIQERIGQGGRKMKVVKFRSMSCNDRGVWVKDGDERVTRVGRFLRKTRIDELPQLYNVLKGEISLVGPRPDICGLGEELKKEIPYYKIRTAVRPGLSGWAQISQENPPRSVEETKERLMYDLYYIKNRSLMLDLKIALRTLGILAARTGV